MFVKTYQTTHVEGLNFSACKFHLYEADLESKTADHYLTSDAFTTLNTGILRDEVSLVPVYCDTVNIKTK